MSKELFYLVALFLYFICWSALALLERISPSSLSKAGANVGMLLFIAAVVVAFINIKWWVVLICLPVIWFIGGWTGGKIARALPATALYLIAAVFLLSLMYHTYYG